MIKACWHVTTGGRRFAMVGAPCDHADALAFARSIWPEAVVS